MPAAIKWSVELENAICNEISVNPKGLEHICKDNADFPGPSAIYERRAESVEFAEKYTRAKANQVMVLADQIIEIADYSQADTLEDEDGKQFVNREIVERSKIRIDARKWLASKLAPKIFGDKLEHTGEVGIKTVIVQAPVKDTTARPAAKPSFDEE